MLLLKAIRELTVGTLSHCIFNHIHWVMCIWVASRARRVAEDWAAAGVGPDDIRALKQLIESQRFKYPITGIKHTFTGDKPHTYPIVRIERINKGKLHIRLGWQPHPLMGHGTTLVVRRGENGWRIEKHTQWIS
jgi:hypothetical protein